MDKFESEIGVDVSSHLHQQFAKVMLEKNASISELNGITIIMIPPNSKP